MRSAKGLNNTHSSVNFSHTSHKKIIHGEAQNLTMTNLAFLHELGQGVVDGVLGRSFHDGGEGALQSSPDGLQRRRLAC